MFRTLSLAAALTLGLAGATAADAKACRDASGKFAACPTPAAAPAAKGCRDAAGHFAKCGAAQAGPPAATAAAAPARNGGFLGMARSAAMSGRPASAAVPAGSPSAKCKDGSLSYSQHRSGTCAGHHGVASWY